MKNYSDNGLERRLMNTINEMQKQLKEMRNNQIGWIGYITFPSLSADPSGAPDGSVYYNTGSSKLRKKNGGVWSDV